MLREENFDKLGLLDYNFGIFKAALTAAKRGDAPPAAPQFRQAPAPPG